MNQSQPNRPPNGFLMFCHIHRKVVRQNNLKQENRVVTKILGQWWGTLSSAEKAPFEEKAKQHRTKLYEKNPTFKWHSPKESFGSTLVTRQQSHNRSRTGPAPLSSNLAITPGKLADLDQMGGLSALMIGPSALKRPQAVPQETDYRTDNNNSTSVSCSNDACLSTNPVIPHVHSNSSAKEKITGAAKKRKLFTPMKRGEDGVQNSLNFRVLLKDCPMYDYEDYLTRKAEGKKATKKATKKKFKKTEKEKPETVGDGDSASRPTWNDLLRAAAYINSEATVGQNVQSDGLNYCSPNPT